MKFSPQEEENLILQYNKLIWRTVHRFQRRMSSLIYNKEDLYQEAVMVFVRHLREAPDMDKVQNGIPIREMINAMTRYALQDQVVTYPIRTSSFRQIMASCPKRTEYSDVDRDDALRSYTEDDVLTNVDAQAFFASLSPIDRRILRMKAQGIDNRAIGKTVGETDVQICRHIQRLRKKYAAIAA